MCMRPHQAKAVSSPEGCTACAVHLGPRRAPAAPPWASARHESAPRTEKRPAPTVACTMAGKLRALHAVELGPGAPATRDRQARASAVSNSARATAGRRRAPHLLPAGALRGGRLRLAQRGRRRAVRRGRRRLGLRGVRGGGRHVPGSRRGRRRALLVRLGLAGLGAGGGLLARLRDAVPGSVGAWARRSRTPTKRASEMRAAPAGASSSAALVGCDLLPRLAARACKDPEVPQGPGKRSSRPGPPPRPPAHQGRPSPAGR